MGSSKIQQFISGLFVLLLVTWPNGSMATDHPEPIQRWQRAIDSHVDATKERLQGIRAKMAPHMHRGLQSIGDLFEHQRSAALSCNSKHAKMLDGESKFVFMAKEIENMNISMMAEQSICPRPTMVSNVWATKREITCFDVDGNEMLCDEFCEDQYPVIGVPSVRPSVDDLETCVGNPNWSECRSVDMFSEILTPNCSPVPSAGWIEVNGHFTASCCEPGGLIVPWKSRKCALPFHLTTLPPSNVRVKALDNCEPYVKIEWKRPPMDHICPVEIDEYVISCASLDNSTTHVASEAESSAEISVLANEKYLCSMKSISKDDGESRTVHSRPVVYRYPTKCLPAAPTDVATQFDGSLEQNTRKVTWSPAFSPNSPVLKYNVLCVSGDMESSALVSGDSFSAVVSDLELGSNVYTCTVTAITAAGSGLTSTPSKPFATPAILEMEKYPSTGSSAPYGVWLVDRFEPAVWDKMSYNGKTDVLVAGVDKDDVDTTSSFTNNQGRQYRFKESINVNDSIVQSGSMFIPSAWSVVDLADTNTWKTATFWSSIYAPPGQQGQGPFSVVGFKNAPFKGLANSDDQDGSSNYIQFVAWDPNNGYWAVDPTNFPVLFDQWNDFMVKMKIKEADPSSSTSRTISYLYYINGDLVAEFADISLDDGLTDLVFLVNTVNACSGFSNYNEAVCDKTVPGNSCCTGSTYDSYRTLDSYIIRG